MYQHYGACTAAHCLLTCACVGVGRRCLTITASLLLQEVVRILQGESATGPFGEDIQELAEASGGILKAWFPLSAMYIESLTHPVAHVTSSGEILPVRCGVRISCCLPCADQLVAVQVAVGEAQVKTVLGHHYRCGIPYEPEDSVHPGIKYRCKQTASNNCTAVGFLLCS